LRQTSSFIAGTQPDGWNIRTRRRGLQDVREIAGSVQVTE
jgi:hypothetical protein